MLKKKKGKIQLRKKWPVFTHTGKETTSVNIVKEL
jgi:hypothetical protein